mmetsp:Transcript_110752/g.196204  ORF Transcript_110752/g.196204 Transcript_110752/m.196204 type:complete len:194 (-) Transcript_110752:121-702(-)
MSSGGDSIGVAASAAAASSAARQCAETLALLRERAARGGAAGEVKQALPAGESGGKSSVRRSLLLRKERVKKSMEDVREEMRYLQAECERYAKQERATEILQGSTDAVMAAMQDEFEKVRGQLGRARQQIAEHSRAQAALKEEIDHRTQSFKDMVNTGDDARHGAELEAVEMRRLCQEMRARIHTKKSGSASL